VAWRPNVQSGFLRTLLGDPDQATFRGGYTLSYERQGMAVFTDLYGSNPGSTISLSRTENLGNLVLPGETWPIYLTQRSRLYTQGFAETPTFPIALRPPPARGRSASSARSRGTWQSKPDTSGRAGSTSGPS
jgi:hypothetical protein